MHFRQLFLNENIRIAQGNFRKNVKVLPYLSQSLKMDNKVFVGFINKRKGFLMNSWNPFIELVLRPLAFNGCATKWHRNVVLNMFT